jgi:hypothetical protein
VTLLESEFSNRAAVRGEPISNDLLRMDALVLEQFSQQPRRGAGIATFLNKNVQHFAFVVDGSPEGLSGQLDRRRVKGTVKLT